MRVTPVIPKRPINGVKFGEIGRQHRIGVRGGTGGEKKRGSRLNGEFFLSEREVNSGADDDTGPVGEKLRQDPAHLTLIDQNVIGPFHRNRFRREPCHGATHRQARKQR